jgi:hypothetical protein
MSSKILFILFGLLVVLGVAYYASIAQQNKNVSKFQDAVHGGGVSVSVESSKTFPEFASFLLTLNPGDRCYFSSPNYHGYVEKGIHNDEWQYVLFNQENQMILFPSYAQMITHLHKIILVSPQFIVSTNSCSFGIRSIGSSKNQPPQVMQGANDEEEEERAEGYKDNMRA